MEYNQFAYCLNSPVNCIDSNGYLAKWLSGTINIIGGITQVALGAVLGAFSSWTGIGAIVASFLVVNGTATVTQGIGKIVNNISKSNVIREDHIIRTGARAAGRTIGGAIGEKVAEIVYDGAVAAANLYASKVCLGESMPRIVNSKIFEINEGYGIKIGKTAKSSYGRINLLYQNPSFLKQYGVRGGTFISIHNVAGDCLFRIDWDPVKGVHFQ